MRTLLPAFVALALVPAVIHAQDPTLLRPVPPVHCAPDDARIEVLLLGSYHMSNPGADMFNVEADDVLAPKRQAEIEDLVERLAAFRPTRVAIEADWGDSTEPARYRAYRSGSHELSRSESQQIGFRLARRMDLPEVDAIDMSGEFPFGQVQELAQSDSTLMSHLAAGRAIGQAAVEEIGRWLAEGTIGETLHRMNSPEAIHQSHEVYLEYLLPVVAEHAAPGADLVAAWYERNIRIFANLHRMGLEPGDRVFVIYGAGHVPILKHLVANSPYFCVEDPLRYLPVP